MTRKTNVRQHTRQVKGRQCNVVRHERRLPPQLGRVGLVNDKDARLAMVHARRLESEEGSSTRARLAMVHARRLAHENRTLVTELTENEVRSLLRRVNTGSLTPAQFGKQTPEGGYTLTQDQVTKGRAWLMKQWKTPLGTERTNNPFGYREEAALQGFKTIKLIDIYSPRGNHYYPLYRVEGSRGTFDYTVIDGEINILG